MQDAQKCLVHGLNVLLDSFEKEAKAAKSISVPQVPLKKEDHDVIVSSSGVWRSCNLHVIAGDQEDSNWGDNEAIPDTQAVAGESQPDKSFRGNQDRRLAGPSQYRNLEHV